MGLVYNITTIISIITYKKVLVHVKYNKKRYSLVK